MNITQNNGSASGGSDSASASTGNATNNAYDQEASLNAQVIHSMAIASQQRDLRDMYKEVDLDAIYHHFTDITPSSVFIKITYEEAESMIRLRSLQRSENERQLRYKKMNKKPPPLGEATINEMKHDETILAKLSLRIDEELKKQPFFGKAFMKTNAFSPKDYIYHHPEEITVHYKNIVSQRGKPASLSEKLDFLEEAKKEILMIDSGKRALELLMGSARIMDGIEDDLKHAGNVGIEEPMGSSIAIREWHPIRNHNEFRIFVYKGHVSGISQTFYHIRYQYLADNTASVEKIIMDFAYKLIERLKSTQTIEPSVTIDIGIDDKGKVLLIEFNPFKLHEGVNTSSGLFDWEKDKNILMSGDKYEFRIQKSEHNQHLELLLSRKDNWPEVFQQLLSESNDLTSYEAFLKSIGY